MRNFMKKKSIIVSTTLILFLITGILLYQLYCRYYTITFQPQTYTATDRHLSNPYQGWYRIFGYVLSDTEPITLENLSSEYNNYSCEIALLVINLRNYTASDISASALTQLDTIFSAWQKEGKQLIVRFLYDWDGHARETEPKDISIIKRHMTQTSGLVNQYKDCIYLLQGIFVGNNGEMNNSDYMAEDFMRSLAEYLASVIDPSIYLSVRTPAHWRTISQSFEPLTSAQAFGSTLSARTGLYNDGMLASENDLGTYGDTSLSLAETFSDKGTRAEEIDFQNTLCNYVPNGGEVVLDNTCNDFNNALPDLRNMRISYLNYDYDQNVLEKWKSAVYEGDDCFNGCSGYDYIGEHLGYRYALISSDCTFDTLQDDTATMHLTIENSGFSGSYRPFSSQITVINRDTDETYTIPLNVDSRYWPGGKTVTLSVPLDIRTWQTGTYDIYYSLTDPATNRQIRFANTLIPSENGYLVAALEISKRP